MLKVFLQFIVNWVQTLSPEETTSVGVAFVSPTLLWKFLNRGVYLCIFGNI